MCKSSWTCGTYMMAPVGEKYSVWLLYQCSLVWRRFYLDFWLPPYLHFREGCFTSSSPFLSLSHCRPQCPAPSSHQGPHHRVPRLVDWQQWRWSQQKLSSQEQEERRSVPRETGALTQPSGLNGGRVSCPSTHAVNLKSYVMCQKS